MNPIEKYQDLIMDFLMNYNKVREAVLGTDAMWAEADALASELRNGLWELMEADS